MPAGGGRCRGRGSSPGPRAIGAGLTAQRRQGLPVHRTPGALPRQVAAVVSLGTAGSAVWVVLVGGNPVQIPADMTITLWHPSGGSRHLTVAGVRLGRPSLTAHVVQPGTGMPGVPWIPLTAHRRPASLFRLHSHGGLLGGVAPGIRAGLVRHFIELAVRVRPLAGGNQAPGPARLIPGLAGPSTR